MQLDALIRWLQASERRKEKQQQQHAQHFFNTKTGHLHDHFFFFFFSLSFSLCFVLFSIIFWNVCFCFPFAKLRVFSFVFLRYRFPSFTLGFDGICWLFWFFFETSSLTYHANSRPPTKQIQIKPFSNIQMHTIFFPPHCNAMPMQQHGAAQPMCAYEVKEIMRCVGAAVCLLTKANEIFAASSTCRWQFISLHS